MLSARSTHRASKTVEYRTWTWMKTRCYNPQCKDYLNYGGRGITVCDRWRNDFATFLADLGPRPSPQHSLDRFPNWEGNYEPGNVRWATTAEQSNNRRDTRRLTYEGATRTLHDWAMVTGISRRTIANRLAKGWSLTRAFTTPVAKQVRHSVA